jgi:hypothetical protein
MKLTAILTALSLTAALACGKKKDDAPPAPAPTPKPTEPAAVTPPAPPPAPAAPTYSPEAAKAAVGELTKCTSEFNCAAFDTLIGFGAKAAPELVALAVDAAATSDARQLAAAALTKLKAPDVGAALIEAANAVKDDSMLQGDLFEAAGASGGQAVFDTLIAEFVKAAASTDDDREIPLRHGLGAFPAESVAWVKANMAKAKDDQTYYADLITDSATAADLPTIVETARRHQGPDGASPPRGQGDRAGRRRALRRVRRRPQVQGRLRSLGRRQLPRRRRRQGAGRAQGRADRAVAEGQGRRQRRPHRDGLRQGPQAARCARRALTAHGMRNSLWVCSDTRHGG